VKSELATEAGETGFVYCVREDLIVTFYVLIKRLSTELKLK